jgi:hypothetical protein
MDTRHPNSNLIPMILAEATSVFRYQLYRQERSGLFSAQFETNNAAKAVEAFLAQNPAFEHGCLRLWNHREQRICASIVWLGDETEFGFTVYRRVNRFHDDLLAAIAHQPMTPFQPVDRLHQWGIQIREAA